MKVAVAYERCSTFIPRPRQRPKAGVEYTLASISNLSAGRCGDGGAELALLLLLPPSTYVIPRVLRKPSRFGDWRECESAREGERVLNSENVNTNTAACAVRASNVALPIPVRFSFSLDILEKKPKSVPIRGRSRSARGKDLERQRGRKGRSSANLKGTT